jgi:hypothetical protein
VSVVASKDELVGSRGRDMRRMTQAAVLAMLSVGLAAVTDVQSGSGQQAPVGVDQGASSARAAPAGFSVGFRKELGAGLVGDVHVNFSCTAQLLEAAGSVAAGTNVRVASYDVALGKVSPEGMTTKIHSRGMWHLDLNSKEAIVRTYSTSNFSSLVDISELPKLVKFVCRPCGNKTWRHVQSKIDVEASLEFVE